MSDRQLEIGARGALSVEEIDRLQRLLRRLVPASEGGPSLLELAAILVSREASQQRDAHQRRALGVTDDQGVN